MLLFRKTTSERVVQNKPGPWWLRCSRLIPLVTPNIFGIRMKICQASHGRNEQYKVINLRSDTFGNPIFQMVLQNQPSSRIISVLGCFAWLCQLVAKCKNGLTKSIFYIKNHPNLSQSFFLSQKNTNLGTQFSY